MPTTAETIHMSFTGHDRKVVTAVVEEGIDAWLEGFIHSTFRDNGQRLTCEFAPEEMSILLRRLSAIAETDEEAELLVEDIVNVCYRDEE